MNATPVKVEVSDLYATGFKAVADAGGFTGCADPEYLRIGREQTAAHEGRHHVGRHPHRAGQGRPRRSRHSPVPTLVVRPAGHPQGLVRSGVHPRLRGTGPVASTTPG